MLTDVRTSIIQYNSCKRIPQVSTERHLFKVYYQDGNDLLCAYGRCEMELLFAAFVHSVFLQCFIIAYWIFFPYSLIEWKYVISQKIASVS